jgi:RHS repeat-associated protein
VSGPAGTVRYVYDGEGHRVQQVTPAGTYNYLVDRVAPLPVVIREEGPEGTIDYVHGAGLISALGSTFQHFYQFDGVGSVVSVTDAAGALRAHYGYDPWGNPLWPDALGARNKYRFTSEPWDAASGLYHFRARYYDPTLGRFLSNDPLGHGIEGLQPGHPYGYALNNPLRLNDRSGLVPAEATYASAYDTVRNLSLAYRVVTAIRDVVKYFRVLWGAQKEFDLVSDIDRAYNNGSEETRKFINDNLQEALPPAIKQKYVQAVTWDKLTPDEKAKAVEDGLFNQALEGRGILVKDYRMLPKHFPPVGTLP